jgi:glucose-6-phosphate isomerase
MNFDPGFDLRVSTDPMGFHYGPGVFGPEPEYRRLEAIRQSLLDPVCMGPDPVYGIAMDTGRTSDRETLEEMNLLFGVVVYAAGRLGREPVRTQGHVHKISSNSGWSAPEIFEVWCGTAVILMQESDGDDPGRCFAVEARPADRVVCPPGWAHAVASVSASEPLIFGAWCDRDFGFVYDGVRRHGGLAWFPQLAADGSLDFVANPGYCHSHDLVRRRARAYPELGLPPDGPMYRLLTRDPGAVQWVSSPGQRSEVWQNFEP